MPVVSSDAVRRQIASGAIAPVYLLVGDDDRLIAEISNSISDTLEQDLRPFNYERLYVTDKGVSADSVIEVARLAPMMAPRRLVVVLRAEDWLKPRRPPAGTGEPAEAPEGAAESGAAEKGAMGPLIQYLKAPVSTTTLVFVAADVNRSTTLARTFYKQATVVECWGLAADRDAPRGGGDFIRQGIAEVKGAATAAGRQFEPAAARKLAEASGGDIAKLRADIDHVLLFAEGARAVTPADVAAAVAGHETIQDPWAIVNAIERANRAEALRLLAIALETGEAPVKVLGQLAWFVREKLPKVRPRQVPSAIQAVFRTDLDLKSSGGEPRVLLERLVLELCRRK